MNIEDYFQSNQHWLIPVIITLSISIPFVIYSYLSPIDRDFTDDWITNQASCSELKDYILYGHDDERIHEGTIWKEDAKERFIWMCEK